MLKYRISHLITGEELNLTVFSGTFNPIHIAHLIIAESVRIQFNADKILFIPAYIPPHRENDLASPEHRLNMVNLAIQDNPFFESSNIEFLRHEKSYTYDTIKKLREENSSISGKINLIIGSDAFKFIDSWHKPDKLADLANFIIVPRPDNSDISQIFNEIKLQNFTYQIAKAPLLDISSSYIRKRISENKSIKYLVPKLVEEYIYSNSLYKGEK